MVTISERLIISSFAFWAGDYPFLKILYEQNLSVGLEDEKNPILHFFESLDEENFNFFEKTTKYLKERKDNKQYSILETDHWRATIWKINDFEYCLKGYLKKLEDKDDVFIRLSQMQSYMIKNHISEGDFSHAFSFGRKMNCIFRIDEMGLIEGTYYICERNPVRARQKVILTFKNVLRNFKDGPVRHHQLSLSLTD